MSRRGVKSIYAKPSGAPVASPEPPQGLAFYCGHCRQPSTGTHYRCQVSAKGFCEACDSDPGRAADGLVTGRTCRKCYDRNRRAARASASPQAQAKGKPRKKKRAVTVADVSSASEDEWTVGGSKRGKRSASDSTADGGRQDGSRKKAKRKTKKPSKEEEEELDYGYTTPWGESGMPGGSQPPVMARRSAVTRPIEYLEVFREIIRKNPDYRRVLDSSLPEERREKVWDLMDEDVVDKFAWAIPDERALRIIQAIDIENARNGVIEVGAGAGYWAGLMLQRGIDVLAFDLKECDKYAPVKVGSPDVVKDHPGRILFLCYPDEFEESHESMALQCLEKFAGDYVIHVGELFGRTVGVAEWGRSSAVEFQERLARHFHEVVSVPLPSWPFARDTLTVWKRTRTLITDDGIFRDIPPNEL
eukprot:CAMPEP_0114623100 /NCGR_PEP_ID=MMETSP0168-20121206/10073_1 /TAXON_ID=95228 ORGANISM="Vannella sp., Strain DIVA3 517/6/12" /NCGR_SAMPLE_ID=MMETSP0168 /ASSEMBLY_ACC=CAM_ASM_000044 /LENGTH=416 /DNA_ID=CAMNT_0001834325 /DNA_START=239 /DNA_END=1486 /DNA_ORIENTATION=+